jgi:hypothetical protein
VCVCVQGAWAVNVDWSPDQAIHGAHDATPVDPEHLYGVEASANATRFVVSLAEDAGEKCSPFAIFDDDVMTNGGLPRQARDERKGNCFQNGAFRAGFDHEQPHHESQPLLRPIVYADKPDILNPGEERRICSPEFSYDT